MFKERLLLTMKKKLPEFYDRYPDALDRYYGGLRRAPDSYANLVYYSKINTRFVGTDGVARSARFRLLQWDSDGSEPGQMTQRDRDGFLDTERWPEEKRAKDSLRNELKQRLGQGKINYRLQIAIRDSVDDYSDSSYDPTRAWDEQQFPWRDLARIILTDPLEDEVTEALEFNIANAPASLGVFKAGRSTDFTSVGHLRTTLYKRSAWARRLRR